MAVNLYSDISAQLTTFISVDRDAGGEPTTFFGRRSWRNNKTRNMSRPIIPNLRTWPRNLSTSQGGGLSTSQYGGMSTSQYGGASKTQYGGLSTSQYGGMSTSQYGGLSTSQYGGLSTSQFGGLSTSQYGGLSTSQYGGLSTSQGGGMSTSSSNVYKSNIPPWPYFVRELESRGYDWASEMIKHYLPEYLWPENFFGHR